VAAHPSFFKTYGDGMKFSLSVLFTALMLTFSVFGADLIRVTKFINHTGSELKKNQAAVVKIKEVVQGDCFKNELLNRKLIQTSGKTSLQVLETLLNADVQIKLSMYRKRLSKVHGYTYEKSDTINLNRKYHNNYGICSVANNLSHEWSHKVGFGHDYKPSLQRPYSVPYSMNAIFEKCCKD
jgi:hypothetical protein